MRKRGICRRKLGQMELSFGMIFSIILIIAFVAFSIYGIIKFLEFRDCAQIGTFQKNFEAHVKAKWSGTEGAENHEYTLPGKIEAVCFINEEKPITNSEMKEELKWVHLDNGENMVFYPPKSACNSESAKIDHLNIEEITKEDNGNPFCIPNKNGKVRLTLQKNYGENSVRVLRVQ